MSLTVCRPYAFVRAGMLTRRLFGAWMHWPVADWETTNHTESGSPSARYRYTVAREPPTSSRCRWQ